MMNTKEQLLAFLSAAVWDRPVSAAPVVSSWEDLYDLAKEHGVIPLVYTATEPYRSQMPKEVLTQWRGKTIGIVMNNEKLMQAQKEVVELLQSNGIFCAVLKGSSFSACYPKPELRPLGDIDLLIDPCNMGKAVELLTECGFHAPETDHPFHVDFYKNGVVLEIHGAVSEFPNSPGGKEAEEIMAGALLNVKQAKMGEYSFPILSNVHQALNALLHMERHMTTSSIGLRQMYDWAALLSHIPVEEFEREIVPAIRQCGLEKFAKVITKACVTYLHMDWGYGAWFKEIDGGLTEQMMDEIFRAGNFHQTKNSSDIGHLMVSRSGSGYLGNLVRTLFNLIQKHFPAVQKYPILRPFLAVYIAVRYAVRSAFGLRPQVSVSDTITTARNRNQLYRDLQLYEVKNS